MTTKTNEQLSQETIRSLAMFKTLIKAGCRYEGDTLSRKWSEYLLISIDIEEHVRELLDIYEFVEGDDFKIENGLIWIK